MHVKLFLLVLALVTSQVSSEETQLLNALRALITKESELADKVPAVSAEEPRSCSQNGVVYTIVPGSNCTAFTKYSASEQIKKNAVANQCPAGLVFDPIICVCNWPSDENKCQDQADIKVGEDDTTLTMLATETTSEPATTTGSSTTYRPSSSTTESELLELTEPNTTEDSHGADLDAGSSSVEDMRTGLHSESGTAEGQFEHSAYDSDNHGHTYSTGNSPFCIRDEQVYTITPRTGCQTYSQQVLKTNYVQLNTCPSNLVFDVQACVCNWPKNTGRCFDEDTTAEELTAAKADDNTTEPETRGYRGDDRDHYCRIPETGYIHFIVPGTDCQRYIRTKDGVHEELECDYNSYFDVQACDCRRAQDFGYGGYKNCRW